MQTNTRQQQKGMWEDAVSDNELKSPHVKIQQESAFTLIASILSFKQIVKPHCQYLNMKLSCKGVSVHLKQWAGRISY